MAQVHVLPPSIASQIAAGEVVERPASAVKELIENALDARATRCDVACQGGGVTLLSVRDDGFGMSEEDAVRAVERHATSKLTQLSDLDHLDTFGFRGEALPTIASVSRFSLRTRAHDSDHGCSVDIDCGRAPVVRREGLPVGTTVTVRELFVNVPARRKFLRSTGTESAHVTAAVEGAALSRPEVTFTLERDGRKVRELLRVASRRDRVLQLLPEEILTEIRGERGPLRFEAHLSRPERARPGTSGLWLLVNGRVVRDRMLSATVAQAYGAALSPGHYPRGVVYVDLPSELVDVNVHPQKAEVRFVDARALADAVYAIVSRGAMTEFGIASVSRGARYAPPTRTRDPSPMDLLPVERGPVPKRKHEDGGGRQHPLSDPPPTVARIESETTSPTLRPPAPSDASRAGALSDASRAVARIESETASPTLRPPPALDDAPQPSALHDAPQRSSAANGVLQPRAPGGARHPSASDAEALEESAPVTKVTPPSDPTYGASARVEDFDFAGNRRDREQGVGPLRFLAQVRQTFLVCEGPDGLYVVDQHAAAERVTYARFLAEYRTQSVATQTLLFPAMLELTAKELACVEEQLHVFRDLGLDVRVRGTDRISVHTAPRLLPRAAPEQLVRDVLGELMARGARAEATAVEQALTSMVCHGCLGPSEVLTAPEAQRLLDAFSAVSTTTRSVHGRPLAAILRYSDLERQAGRR